MMDGVDPGSIDNRVVVRLHRSIIPPCLADVATTSLEGVSKDFVPGGPCGVQSTPTTHRLCQCAGDGYLNVRTGLLPRIVDECETQGIPIQIIDHSRWPVLEQAAENLAEIVTDDNRNLLNAVIDNPRGQLITSGEQQQRSFLWCISQLFPDRRILIVVSSGEQRDRIHGFLSSFLDRPVFTHRNIDWFARNRIVVVTTQSFSINPVNDDWDIILFASPEAAVATQSFEMASRVEKELMYCLRHSGFDSDNLTRLRLEATCGPPIYGANEPKPIVQVVMAEAPSIQPSGKLPALERKRRTIWHNDQRNDRVADMAIAVANRNSRTFSQRSETLSRGLEVVNDFPNPGIAILVESSEHGRELQRRLPGWTLHTAVPNRDGVLDGGTCHRSIITQTFAGLGVYTDILIRATGTASPLVVKGFPSVQQRRAIVLFDLADDFDAQAMRDTRERIRDYQSRGWRVEAGTDRSIPRCAGIEESHRS